MFDGSTLASQFCSLKLSHINYCMPYETIERSSGDHLVSSYVVQQLEMTFLALLCHPRVFTRSISLTHYAKQLRLIFEWKGGFFTKVNPFYMSFKLKYAISHIHWFPFLFRFFNNLRLIHQKHFSNNLVLH